MQRFLIWAIMALGISGVGRAAAAQESCTYEIQTLSVAPVMDGMVDNDPAWKDVPLTGKFSPVGRRVVSVQRHTQFRMGAMADGLYVGIVCVEPHAGQISVLGKDGDPGICNGDSIELFVLPDGAQEYFHFMIGAEGARWNGRSRDASEMPLGNWQVVSYRSLSSYSLEVMIPFDVLGVTPVKADVWTGNLCRNAVAGGDREFSSWSKLKLGFHEPESFGRIVFAADVAGPEARQRQAETVSRQIEACMRELGRLEKPLMDAQARDTSLRRAIAEFLEECRQMRHAMLATQTASITKRKELRDSCKKLIGKGDTILGRALLEYLVDIH